MRQPPAHGGGYHGGAAAPQPQAAPGVEIVLITGSSPTTRASFAPGVPPAQTAIGSAPQAGWRVSARGVEPMHAELAWDGQRVWVRDAGSTNGTYVGVERIDDWRALGPGDKVQIGEAAFVVMGPEATAPEDYDPLGEESTHVASGNAAQAVVQAAAGVLPRAPSTAAASNNGPFGSESTVITSSPLDPSATPAPSPAIRAMGIPPPRMNRPTPGPGAVPPPRFGAAAAPAPGGYTERPDEATVAISTESPGAPMVTPFLSDAPPPMGPPGGAMPAVPPPMTGYGVAPSTDFQWNPGLSSPSDPGRPPPGELTSMFGALPPAPAAAQTPSPVANLKAGFTALPQRTRILVGVTLVAGTLMLVIGLVRHGDDGAATAPAAGNTHARPTATAPTTQFTPPIPGPPAAPTGTLLAATTAPPPPPPPPPVHGHAARQPPPPPPSPDALAEQTAAETLASGRYRDALVQYQSLATAHPDSPVYNQIVTILRRKLEAQQTCPPGSTTCSPTAPAAGH